MAVAFAVDKLEKVKKAGSERAYAVICDEGTTAAVVVLHLPHPPAPGLQFAAFGILWEVVLGKDHCRGAVARPVPQHLQGRSQGVGCMMGMEAQAHGNTGEHHRPHTAGGGDPGVPVVAPVRC